MSASPERPAAKIDQRHLLQDPRWFPIDLDVTAGRFSMLRVDDETLRRSSFLDTRIDSPAGEVAYLPAHAVTSDGLPDPDIGWLWHTSFCCSTLLARALHVPPYQVCLKEPLPLRRLGDARAAGVDTRHALAPTLRLLARPWDQGAAVVIKPTHAALNVAHDLMDAAPRSRGVVITSTLRDFLVSNLKKTAETQSRIPVLADRALRVGGFRLRLAGPAFAPPDLLSAAALQWAAQQEILHELYLHVGSERLMWVDQQQLLGALHATVRMVADWLRLPAPWDALERNAVEVSGRNAKALDVAYDAKARSAEAEFVTGMYAEQIASALTWATTHLLPLMHSRRLDA